MLLRSKHFQSDTDRATWFYNLDELNQHLPLEVGGFALKDRYPSQGMAYNEDCDVIFMILDGQGTIFVEGSTFNVSKGDVVSVPKQNKYLIKATMGSELRAWVLTNPKFRFEQHKIKAK